MYITKNIKAIVLALITLYVVAIGTLPAVDNIRMSAKDELVSVTFLYTAIFTAYLLLKTIRDEKD